MTTPDQFAQAVRELCQQLGGSVTSWGRTESHSVAVGGFAGDPHTHWYGADVVWDGAADAQRCADRHAIAAQHGLNLIHEKAHDHLQPLDYPPGTLSDKQVEAWKVRSK